MKTVVAQLQRGLIERRSTLAAAALFTVAMLLLLNPLSSSGQADRPSFLDNNRTVGNTRHNLTQRQPDGKTPPLVQFMDSTRNDYMEVCVYCHTPHQANRTTTAPLWNRTMKVTTYQTYNQLNTSSLTQPVTQPGVNSLTCLSCHDGQTAVDAIINMPGSGRANSAMETSDSDTAFLNSWDNTRGPDATQHGRIGTECYVCHTAAGGVALGATDFTAFIIGTDLRNDHPVGVRFPTTAGAGTDFNDPSRKEARLAYFDTNGNQHADKGEIRLYNTGDGYEVECASCHDPHGVPSGGPASTFNPSFLRVNNAGSAVCLTCHIK
jgi:mono/diheme cytochrome c family protein